MALTDPKGLLPALLDLSIGNEAYEAALAAYRLGTLTNLMPRNPDFSGREQALSQLAEGLQQAPQAITHSQAIAGLGGVGKSQLANEYAYRHRAEYAICRWLVSEGDAIKLSMESLAIDLGIDPKGLEIPALVRAVYAELNRYGSWLLIFDNVDTPQAIKPYLPTQQQANQQVLITSRSQGFRHQVTVNQFSLDEAKAYLSAHLSQIAV